VPGNPTSCNVSGLIAGTYTLEITDSNLCMETFLVAISDVNGPDVSISKTNTSCNGICDGQATANATGFGTLDYRWQTGGETTPTITALCPGNYTVEVSDGNGCKTTKLTTINEINPISATVSTVKTTCNSDCDGAALVSASGGIPPYDYSWTGGNAEGQTLKAVGGLCAGNYTVTITDFVGCSIVKNILINEPDQLSVTLSGTAANCNESCDGLANASPFGGTPPYQYAWNNGLKTPTITALCTGNYTVTITDFNGCTSERSISIGQGNPITASIDTTSATCGQCDGSILTSAGGGAGAPYQYDWGIIGASSPTISNLCPGAYSLTITDNIGCSQQFNIPIDNSNGPILVSEADSASCFAICDGLAYTNTASSSSNYIYQWDDPLLQTSDSATSLCAGLFNVIVEDSSGCISIDSVSVLEPEKIKTNIIAVNPSCIDVCDGTATVEITGGIGSPTIDWGANSGNQTTPIATNLCAGTYIVSVNYNNGCSTIDSVTITGPDSISIAINTTQPTCFGDCDGTILATASGGTPGYDYSWNTSPSQKNALIGGLCATTSSLMVVTVTDKNGCIASDSSAITNPVILSTSTSSFDPTCANTCNGEITANPIGGVQPYRYIWNNGDTTQTITSLCQGLYWVTIVDENNCTVSDTVNINEPILNAGITPSTADCGVCNGSISSSPVGSGTFNFIWTNTANPSLIIQSDLNVSNSEVNGLCAGSYNLEIIDLSSGCLLDFPILLNTTNAPDIVLSSSDETCLNRCDGSASVIATGGTLPYTYQWVPSQNAGDTLATINGLCADFYTVSVTDSNNCISTDTLTIHTIPFNIVLENVVPETCFGNCDGIATVSTIGGTPDYNYLWNPTGQISSQATGLCIGGYVATVTDDNNCQDSISTVITSPDQLAVVVQENRAISCNGNNDGNLIANVSGGTPNYRYSWNTLPVQNSQIATNLNAGTYIVTVTDDNNCSVVDTFILTEPTLILDNSTVQLPNCGACDGRIELNPSGGSGNYSFTWITPSSPPETPALNTAIIGSLCAGAYTVTVVDNISGCTSVFNYALSNLNSPDPNTTVTYPTCNGFCNGEIISNPIGNAPPYTFAWSPSGTSNSITDLCAGTYELNVTDTNGCVGVAIDNVIEPDILLANLSASNINCNGICDGIVSATPTGGTIPYTYDWSTVSSIDSSISGLCADTYIITIRDNNSNCEVIDSISITEPSIITTIVTQTNATCISICDGAITITPSGGVGPYDFQWNGNLTPGQGNTISNLCTGTYEVETFDQNGCSVSDTIEINAIDSVLSNAGNDTNYCLGSTITLNGIPGGNFTTVEWFELPSMISLGRTESISISPVDSGTFCYAFEVSGTCSISDTVCITIDPLPNLDAGEDISIFEDENSTLNATGAFSYNWASNSTLNDTTISNPIASPFATTTYFVTGTSENGCIASDSIEVTVLPIINISDGISPNGDGTNDVWVIDYIERYNNNVVEIYNRWGELLFRAKDYQQDWDGNYNGKPLPIGTYYYIINLNDVTIAPFTGPITILR
jgi:gliding motility-associated-like protein